MMAVIQNASRWWKEDSVLPTFGSHFSNGSGGDSSPRMQPRSLVLRRRRYRQLLLILPISISAFLWLKFLQRDTWSSINGCTDSCSTTSDQIPYPPVQDKPPDGSTLPPLYQHYREYEDLVSKSYLTNQTREERYLSFENHVWGSGWGNVLQEMVFNSLLAWESNRSYVWHDYTWNKNGSVYGEFNGKVIPACIPVSTMVAGHFIGFDGTDSASGVSPRPISKRIYDKMCPPRKRKAIKQKQVQKYFERLHPGTKAKIGELSGKQTLNLWVSYLDSPEIRKVKCLEIQKDTPQIFHIWLLGSTRLQNLWGPLIRSPILANWDWSPLIYRAFLKNIRMFATNDPVEDKVFPGSFLDVIKSVLPRSLSPVSTVVASEGSYSRFKTVRGVQRFSQTSEGLVTSNITNLSDVPKEILDSSVRLPVLALHLRRGDFQNHCAHLAKYSSTYTGFSSFPDVAELDAFHVPHVLNHTNSADASTTGARVASPDALLVDSEQEKYDIYYRHCFPDVQQIVQRVRDVVHDFEMELRRRKQNETKDQHWWAWGGVKKDDRRRRDSRTSSSSGKTTQAIESLHSASSSSSNVAPDAKYNAKRSTIPQHERLSRLSPPISLANQILRKVYIMSNGDRQWLSDVADALKADAARSKIGVGRREDGDWEFKFVWEDVGTSRDLDLGWEEKPVAQALDMYIAQRAEVFVGNGFSSMTSNVVMLRLKEGLNHVRTRFW